MYFNLFSILSNLLNFTNGHQNRDHRLSIRHARIHTTEIEGETMIAIGQRAPDFNLRDQFRRDISLGQFKGRRHVMLLFYPLDFTPT